MHGTSTLSCFRTLGETLGRTSTGVHSLNTGAMLVLWNRRCLVSASNAGALEIVLVMFCEDA